MLEPEWTCGFQKQATEPEAMGLSTRASDRPVRTSLVLAVRSIFLENVEDDRSNSERCP